MDNLVQGSPIKTRDIYPDYEHLFNDKAKAALSKPRINKFLPNTRYFAGIAVGEHNIHIIAEKLAAIINDLADRDYIETFMSHFGTLELSIGLTRPIDYAVYAWPILTPEGCVFVDTQNYDLLTVEGGLSKVRISD